MDKSSDGGTVIFRPYITDRNGRKIWAKWFGKRAFPIRIDGRRDSREPKIPGLD